MSAPGRRGPRGGARGGVNDAGEELAIFREIRAGIETLNQNERRAEELIKQIFAKESQIKEAQDAGVKPSLEDIDALSAMYRQQVKIAEDQKALLSRDGQIGLLQNMDILRALVANNEESQEARGSTSRDSYSRSVDHFDGPSDSPGPSPAENRHQRKLGGAARTSSQPPRSNIDIIIRADGPSEPSERSGGKESKPKIVYAVGDEVAFKRKSGEELDWIQGIVTRVIGEGKSRRYEVRDPYPDDPTMETIYKSSASQMVPIPPPNAKLEDYEVGKRVLALYPSTSTFYRADVKRMVEGGKEVLLLFEEELEGQQEKQVDRRLVLDHKG
ncbi:SGF29 tudor-like domain-containing protein [Amylocarpus encephaloides]|uniref:SGF29 tudor-like domain-containing protein n=1 Tax=Amylocarpus encephaloides TaxID=45428 RepID=A0A9P7Y7A6_9HELO|nr:SGF29 tudor-like domain-containing protein [Amylocarpus encephaloides]